MTMLNIDKSNWKKVSLSDVVLKTENNDKLNAKNLFKKFIKAEHLDAESLNIKNFGDQDKDELPPTFYKIFKSNQILYPTRNPHLRRAALAHFDGICGEKTLTLSVNEDVADYRFIAFLFHSNTFYTHTTNCIVGSTNPHVRWRDVANYEFLLPPKEQQAELAELLWAMDNVIEKDLEVLERLESNHLSLQANSFKTNTYESVQLKSFVKIIKGKNPILNEIDGEIYCTAEYLRTGNASQFIDDNNIKKAVTLNDNDIVVLWDGSNAGEILKGKKGVLASTMCKIDVLDKKFNQDFIRQFLNFKSFDIRRATVGSAIPHVDPGMIENIRIPILKENEQLEIIRKFNLIEDNISKLESKLQSSKALQKALINQVF